MTNEVSSSCARPGGRERQWLPASRVTGSSARPRTCSRASTLTRTWPGRGSRTCRKAAGSSRTSGSRTTTGSPCGSTTVRRIAPGATIRAFSHIAGATIGPGAEVGPFARLRPGTDLADHAKVGNFVEVKAARIGTGAKVSHLSYVGDAEVGAHANLGAGTITCNYDGFRKYRTTIGAGAFIGSNSALVAPVAVGAGAIVAAGSVVTADVAADALVLVRPPQVAKPGWAARFRAAKTRGA